MQADARLQLAGSDAAGAGAGCPACGSSMPIPGAQDPHLRMRRCGSCCTLCALPFPSAQKLAAYYNSEYSVIDAGLTPRRRANWVPLLEMAERPAAGRRGLEIGSSTGAFLRLATERGWSMAGIELDDRARAQHAHASPGVPAYATLAAARRDGLRPVDAVWILHTLEHLPDPAAALREAVDALTPGGVLIASTPNGASLECLLLRSLCEWWTPPGHLMLLSPRGARILLERAGLETVSIETRRGDSTGMLGNLALAPARLVKRGVVSSVAQRSSVSSWSQRVARLLNLAYDPLSWPLRRWAYRRMKGPELVLIARKPTQRDMRGVHPRA